MATFTQNKNADTESTLVKVDLANDGGIHDLIYKASGELYIDNSDGGAVTVNLLGDGQTTFACSGIGDLDVSAGIDVSVAAGDTVNVKLSKYKGYLGAEGNSVTVTVTGATASQGWYEV